MVLVAIGNYGRKQSLLRHERTNLVPESDAVVLLEEPLVLSDSVLPVDEASVFVGNGLANTFPCFASPESALGEGEDEGDKDVRHCGFDRFCASSVWVESQGGCV